MRHRTIGSRWNTPAQRYAGGWRENPWINAMYGVAHPGSQLSQSPDGAFEQWDAVGVWENEGGSLDPRAVIG